MNKLFAIWNSNYRHLFRGNIMVVICMGRPLDVISINHFAQLNVIPASAPYSDSREKGMTKGKIVRVLTSGSG